MQSSPPATPGGCALVTGASRGIGRAVALRLARGGTPVALVARSRERLEGTAAAIADAGGRAAVVACDIAAAGGPQAAVDGARAAFGAVRVLVNNAGVYAQGPVQEADLAVWDRLLALNVQALVHLTRAALPALLPLRGAAVINICSVAGRSSYAGGAIYCASKHAVLGFSHALFEDVRAHGVKVCAICPGYVSTEMIGGRGVDAAKALQPDDVADAVAYALGCSATACPTEILLLPQHSPVA